MGCSWNMLPCPAQVEEQEWAYFRLLITTDLYLLCVTREKHAFLPMQFVLVIIQYIIILYSCKVLMPLRV